VLAPCIKFLRKKFRSAYCSDFLSNDNDEANSSSSEEVTPLQVGYCGHSEEGGKQVRVLFLEYFKSN
jgi:hypothetical protein